MIRQNKRPTTTKLGPMSQFMTQPCHDAQSKITGMCQNTMTALKSTTATIGFVTSEPRPRNDLDW